MALVQRVQNICLKPKQEWEVIAGETSSTADLLKNYALPLAAIGAVAGFIGLSFIGMSVPFLGTYRVPMVTGLVSAAVGLAIQLASVFVLGLIIDALAPKFGGEKNSAQALKVAVYSFTPGWAVSVVRILPSLGILAGLASLYGIYVLYLGLPRLMKSPQEKAVTYTLVVVACGIGIFIVAGLISGAIVGAGAMATGALPSGIR
jgi:hypothetical protein